MSAISDAPVPSELERRVMTARRRIRAETPFSPAWDAAMAELEDAEREVWRLGTEPSAAPPPAGRRWAAPGTARAW
jgi:hypothetical protein